MPDTVAAATSITIDHPPSAVFAAVSDVTRMGDWSPENTGGRWVGADGPAVGATFEGDNVARLGPITLKRWTTVSEVTAYEPDSVFEFVTEGTTTWRYEVSPTDTGSRLAESFSFPQHRTVQRILYNMLGSRKKAMTRGMERTLAAVKATLG